MIITSAAKGRPATSGREGEAVMRCVIAGTIIAFLRKGALLHAFDSRTGSPLKKPCSLMDLVGGEDVSPNQGWRLIKGVKSIRRR